MSRQAISEILSALDAEYERLGVFESVRQYPIDAPSREELASIEAEVGCSFPEDYREFLLVNTVSHPFDCNFECQSLGGMHRAWKIMTDILADGKFDDGRVSRIQDSRIKVWWSPMWLPFAEDSCGNMRCIDLNPGPDQGRIIFMEVQDGQGPFVSPFASFSEFLTNHFDLLKKNKVMVDEDGRLQVDSYM